MARTHRRTAAGFRPAVPLTAAGLALLMAVTGCATSSDAPSEPEAGYQDGGTLNIGITGDPGIIDPTFANTLTTNSLFNAMCEYLYQVNDDGKVFPQLAAEPAELNDDNTIATIKLREGVLFQDGTPFDADAVKFTLDRYMNTSGSTRASELSAVDSVEVVDDHTVEIHLDGPTAPGAFDVIFTTKAGIMLSPTAVEELGDDGFAESPVCVGPFKYDSRVAQDSVTLTRDENYYNQDDVHLDSIVYRVIADSSVRATNLRSGDLQVIEAVATTDVATLEADAKVEIIRSTGLGYLNLEFNLHNVAGMTAERGNPGTAVSSDARIRKALELSIDRQAINDVVFNGEYGVACGFMAPSNPLASKKTLECSEPDVEKAKQLIKEAGVATPITVELMFNQRPEIRRMGEMIQSMAAEAGFDIILDINESTTTVDRGYAGDFEIYVNSWSGRIDPDANISRFAESTSERAMGRYLNERVDELLTEARSISDAGERAAAYEEITEILNDDVPFIFLVRPANINGHSSDVGGLHVRANGTVDPSFAGFLAK